ncbi:MAG: O-antigen ligase family protein [Campylobacterota bacterium]|nr:O-antigen ligase family protein [Campylobacterota bacterium]
MFISRERSTDILNYLFLFYAFAIPLSRFGVVLATFLIFIFWLIEGDLKDKVDTILKSKFFLALFAYLSLLLISIIWSQDIMGGIEYIRKFWYFLPIFALYTSLKESYIKKLLYAFLLAMSVSVVASIGILLGFYEGRTPISYFLNNHIMYSFFLSFSLLLIIILFMHEKEKKIKLLYSVLFIAFLIVLFFSTSRSGQFIFFIGLFFIFFMLMQQKLKALGLFVLSSIVIFMIAYTQSERFKHRINYIHSDISNIVEGDKCNSLGGRVFTWQVAYDIAQDAPFLGMGVGDHVEYLKKQMHEDEKFAQCKTLIDMIDYFHSQYIETTTSIGLLGLIVFLLIFNFLYQIEIKNREVDQIKVILLVIFLAIFIVDVLFRKQLALAFFSLIVGLILAQNRVETTKDLRNRV